MALLLGGGIYVAYRSETLLMFDWFPMLKPCRAVLNKTLVSNGLPDWFLFSLPDGLWLLAYILTIGAIWNFHIEDSLALLLLMPVMAVGFEILQFFHLIKGTFDVCDLEFYLLSTSLGFCIIYTCNKYINHKNQKQ